MDLLPGCGKASTAPHSRSVADHAFRERIRTGTFRPLCRIRDGVLALGPGRR